MQSLHAPTRVDLSRVIVQLVLACIVGLILVPSLLAGPSGVVPGSQNLAAIGWLAVSLLVGAWLIVLTPSFVHFIANGISDARRHVFVDTLASTTAEAYHLARWLVAFGVILLIQAIVRPPLVILLSGTMSQSNAEALVAASTLATLFIVLVWVHRTARPLVETAARSTLDVFLASTDVDSTRLATISPTATTLIASRVSSEAATRPAPSLEATVAAPAVPSDREGATRLASVDETLPYSDKTQNGAKSSLGGGR